MMGLARLGLLTLAVSLGAFSLPAASWAHHSSPASGGWSWPLLSVLMLALAFFAVWGVSAFFERRQARRSQRTDPQGDKEP